MRERKDTIVTQRAVSTVRRNLSRECGRRHSGDSVDDVDPAAVAPHERSLDAVLTVLGAVHVNVRPYLLEKRHRHRFIKNVHVVDISNRQQHLGALTLWDQGSRGTLVRSY